jgi:hypothetical protein
VTEDKSKIPHARLPRPEGDGWELDPWGNWSRWEPPPPGGWALGPPIIFTRADLLDRLRPNGEPPPLFTPRSAKPVKRTFITFVPAEWTPAQEAFTRMIAVLGTGLVAARDLQHDLLAGQLIGAVRWRTPEDGWEGCEQLKPSAWQAVRVRTHYASEWKKIEISPGPEFKGNTVNYYISRASLEQRYPLLEETSAASAPSIAAKPEEPERRNTWVTVHDWGVIYAEIARRCIDSAGRLAIPQQNALVADMTAWCGVVLGFAPHERELRGAVKTICDKLREEPKPLKKKPSW